MPESVLSKALEELVNSFSLEKLKDEVLYFKFKDLSPDIYERRLYEFEDEKFSEIYEILKVTLKDSNVLKAYAIRVEGELSERSSKKRQFEVAKKILRTIDNVGTQAGLFTFYDENGNFRFSLVYKVYQPGKTTFSHFKRYTYYIEKGRPYYTFLKQVGYGDFSSIDKIKEAFSIEKVTEEFFEAYKYALKEIIIKSLSRYDLPYQKKHSFGQQLLSRILFIYFLQRKGWLKWKDYVQDKSYIKNLWLKYKSWAKTMQVQDVFYSKWLTSLFFGAFNKKTHLLHPDLPEEIKESFSIMPFLNGGLFSRTELDELDFNLPDNVFEWLFEPDPVDSKKGFLETFNFTIDESLPLDVEVAVDPEMLGKVYESLIAEEERGEAGIFYTPRVEIDFMCRISLVEYLANETKISKDKIIDFIFDPHNENLKLEKEELSLIKRSLDNVKIVDPAVGSASFLVGMMNILVELHQELTRKLENREKNLFALKHKIILENLYGVDVKDWAVMVGELRLWLSLIIDTDEKYMDIYTKPLLPNFSFKIRQGDSLIQEIAGVNINLKNELRNLPKTLRDKIMDLAERKRAFFSGLRSADLKEIREIEEQEKDIFKEIIQMKIDGLKREIMSLENQITTLKSTKKLFGHEKTQKEKEEIKKLGQKVELLKSQLDKNLKLLNTIGTKAQKDYFLWELDFVEVFSQKGGFDIVIGNPPYVRQELIAPPLEDKDKYTEDQWREIKKAYKEKLIQSVKNTWGNNIKIDKKSDIYVYFYYQGLSLLRPGGIFCFINSNSWLDVGYGAGLQEFLLKNMRPIYVFDNLVKRSFKQADVNTVIVLIQRPKNKPDDYNLKFIAFKKPFEDVSNAEVIKTIEKTNQPVFDNENFRIYPKTKNELLLEGVEIPEEQENLLNFGPEHLPYIGNKWGGKYLRAPEIYFRILEKGKGKLVRLGDIAEVRFGIKTGANEFFYLKPVGMSVKEVVEIAEKNPDALIPVRNGAGWEGEIEARFLKPVIKSPRELKTIMVRLEDLNYLVFMCHEPKGKLSGTKALEYIKWGEMQSYQNRPTCRQRERWWNLGEQEISLCGYPMVNYDRLIVSHNGKFYNDANIVGIYPQKSEYKNFLFTMILNSSFNMIYWELFGISNLGEGAIKQNPIYFKQFAIFNPLILDNLSISRMKEIFSNLALRNVNSIFTELGFDPSKPIREQEPNPLPDRKALDDIIFDALGLTEDERKEVYWAVAELVKTRLEKARSV